ERQLNAYKELAERNADAPGPVIRDLYAGRLSLLDAVTRFRAATAWWPPSLQKRIDEFPASSAQERYCRFLIKRARNDLEDDPRCDEVVGRLEADLQQYLTGQAPDPVGKTARPLDQEEPYRSANP